MSEELHQLFVDRTFVLALGETQASVKETLMSISVEATMSKKAKPSMTKKPTPVTKKSKGKKC